MAVVEGALGMTLIGGVFRFMPTGEAWFDFQESQEKLNNKIREVPCIAERGLTLTFVSVGVKMEKGNTNNEKAVFFNRLGGTVNEDELRAS
jgi:hypothetical protein